MKNMKNINHETSNTIMHITYAQKRNNCKKIQNLKWRLMDKEEKHENYFAWILRTTTNKKMNKISLMSYRGTKISLPSFIRYNRINTCTKKVINNNQKNVYFDLR